MGATLGKKKKPGAELSPELEHGLGCMFALLTHEDAAVRQRAVQQVLGNPVPQARALVIGRLIDRLRSPRTATRTRVADALVGVGRCAVACLTAAMLTSKSEYVQVGTAVVLGRLMRTLPHREQRQVYADLVIRCNNARTPRVAGALEKVLAALR